MITINIKDQDIQYLLKGCGAERHKLKAGVLHLDCTQERLDAVLATYTPEIAENLEYNEFDGSAWIENTEKKTEAIRIAEIIAEKKTAGFEKITVSEAWGKIDKLFENKTTAAQIRIACIKAFKLLVVLLLK